MISHDLTQKVLHFVYNSIRRHQVLPERQFTLALRKGELLAQKLGADENVVLLGALFMDSMLSLAIKQDRVEEHIQMAEDKAKRILSRFPKVSKEEKKNILHCIREHHGAGSFYSIESEICCNADCYKFLSIEGIIYGIHEKDMPIGNLVILYKKKVEEKWNALSLDICKKELEPQYRLIKKFFSYFPLEKR